MATYIHDGYCSIIRTVEAYNKASMDMLNKDVRRQIFNKDLPVYTKAKEEVSTYYSVEAVSRNSLVADNCIVEGTVENSIVFSGCRIGKGAVLKNCVVMRNCIIGEGCELENVIVDKDCVFSEDCKLTGNAKLPVVVPKASKL
jgi:glucose-1-phosphate adenylyltransferase